MKKRKEISNISSKKSNCYKFTISLAYFIINSEYTTCKIIFMERIDDRQTASIFSKNINKNNSYIFYILMIHNGKLEQQKCYLFIYCIITFL